MPLIDKEMHRNPTGLDYFLKLASFCVVDVDPVRRDKNMVSVSWIMKIGITDSGNQRFSCMPS